jgi:hypothetical protein
MNKATQRPYRVSRRSVLTGLGSGTVLLSGLLRTVRAAESRPRPRAVFLFYANGSNYAWTPSGAGTSHTLTPHLAPLEAIRPHITILKDLTLQRGKGNPHKAATYSVLGAGGTTSFDQLLAQSLKNTTALPSLELAIGFTSGGGGVAPSLSQVNGVFLPGERNPVAAYQRLASRVSTGPMARDLVSADGALRAQRSLLDSLRADAAGFRSRLGSAERPKLDLYLQSVRDLEKGLGTLATDLAAAPACGKMLPPAGAPGSPGTAGAATFAARVNDMPKVNRLFSDVMAMALGCDITRVISMMWGGGESAEPVDFIGMKDWHGVSHGDPNGLPGQQITRMQAYLAGEVTYLVEKLRKMSAPGAAGAEDGTLLDSTVVVFGTQNGNTNQVNFAKEDHPRWNAPMVLAGRCGGALAPEGRLLDARGANHNDVYLAIARAFGLTLKTVGEPAWCKGPLPGLLA